jgi:hypothetical protein
MKNWHLPHKIVQSHVGFTIGTISRLLKDVIIGGVVSPVVILLLLPVFPSKLHWCIRIESAMSNIAAR